MQRVFISHSSKDIEKAEALAELLRKSGFDPWLDKWEIHGGDVLVHELDDALREAYAGIILVSRASLKSDWVKSEYAVLMKERIHGNKILIPVLLEQKLELPPLLSTLVHLQFDEHQRLLDALLYRKPVTPTGHGSRMHQLHCEILSRKSGHEVVCAVNGHYQDSVPSAPLPQAAQTLVRRFQEGEEFTPEQLRELGSALSDLLLPEEVRQILRDWLRQRANEDEIELCISSPEPKLRGLPWECLWLEGVGHLVLQDGFFLQRSLLLDGKPYVPQAGPLKLMVAVGAPDGVSGLDHEKECQGILDALPEEESQDRFSVRFLEVGHPKQIEGALRKNAYHILHISCHGSRPKQALEGENKAEVCCETGGVCLTLETEDGEPYNTSAAVLMKRLRDTGRAIPLVLLSACHTANVGEAQESLAGELIRGGAHAVIAMQGVVSDRYATELTSELYHILAAGEDFRPGRALARARRAVQRKPLKEGDSKARPLGRECMTATLYLRHKQDPQLANFNLKKEPLDHSWERKKVLGRLPLLEMGQLVGRRKQVRDLVRDLSGDNHRPGYLLRGIGGIGKSALAGRVALRMEEHGYKIVALHGCVTASDVAKVCAKAIRKQDKTLAQALLQDQIPEMLFLILQEALEKHHLLIVLDDYEQNLTTGGTAWRNEDAKALLRALLQAPQRGRVLITCRYSLPAEGLPLSEMEVQRLSGVAEHKLALRLDALWGLDATTQRTVRELTSGHPRMMELVDALLGGKRVKELRTLEQKLEELKAKHGSSKENLSHDVALQQALELELQDILLEELLELVEERGLLEALRQLAVSNLPLDATGLQKMLRGVEHNAPAELLELEGQLQQLSQLSLVSRPDATNAWVHRWTAGGILRTLPQEELAVYARRAGEYRQWRVQQTRSWADGWEAARNFMLSKEWERMSAWASSVLTFFSQHSQARVRELARQILAELPVEAKAVKPMLLFYQADAALVLQGQAGESRLIEEVLRCLQEAVRLGEELVAAEPDRADYQRDLGVSYERMGDLYSALGQGERAREMYADALALRQKLASSEPDRADYQRDLSVSYNKMGDLYRALGQGERAREMYQQTLEISQKLASSEPDRADYQRDLSVSYNKMGDLYRALGQGERAREMYQQTLEISQKLASSEPDRADYQRDLGVSYERMGDLYRALGQGERAREMYQQTLEISQKLASSEPDRADYQRDLSVSYNKMGDLYRALGQGERAREMYADALALRQKLASSEPDRADYQRDLSVSYNKMGDLYRALGQGERAREMYADALALRQKLASSEPDRADYQRDLGVSYERMGDLYRALGQGERAREMYADALALRQKLASSEPDRADYQRDLSVSYNKMGDLYRALGQGERAREMYQQTLEISQKLASSEPDRADYQRDLSVSYNKMGDLYRALGQGERAREMYADALALRQKLASSEPDRADYQRDLGVSYERMGDLYRALGQGERAREMYADALALRQKLASSEPDRADYQRDLSVSYNKMGDLYRALGQGERAREMYQQTLEISQKLASSEPDRADYQRDLGVSYERMGDLYRALGQGERAREMYEQDLAIAKRLASSEPDRADYQSDLAASLECHGMVHLQEKNAEEARQAFSQAIQIREALLKAEPERADHRQALAFTLLQSLGVYRKDTRAHLIRARDLLQGLGDARSKEALAKVEAALGQTLPDEYSQPRSGKDLKKALSRRDK